MLLVVLSGFAGNRKNSLNVEDIVDDSLGMLPEDVTVFRGRGGAGPRKFRKLLKKIEKHAGKDEVLLFVGKSYGGHWSVRLLWKLAEHEKLDKFRSVGMVTVDPAYALHKLQRKVKEIPTIEYARNVHQYGFRSGYRLGDPAKNIAINATHMDIESKARVTEEIQALFRWSCSSDTVL